MTEKNNTTAKRTEVKPAGKTAGAGSKAGTGKAAGKSAAQESKNKNMSRTTRLIGSLGFKIGVVAIILVVLYIGISWGYSFGYALFTQEAVDDAPGTDVIVTIYDDMSENEIANLLYNKGLINDKTNFVIFEKLFTSARYGIIPGEYTLNTSMTPREILDEISDSIAQETTAAPTLGLYESDTESEAETEEMP